MMEFLTVIFMITCVFIALNVGFMIFQCADDFCCRILHDNDKKNIKKNKWIL
jgi:hypothetical protein